VNYNPVYARTFHLFTVTLQSLKDLGRLTYRRLLELFRHMVGLLGRVISPSQGLYLHRTTQHRKTRTNIHALSGIRAHDPSNQPAKTHASDRTATVTGNFPLVSLKYINIRSKRRFISCLLMHLFIGNRLLREQHSLKLRAFTLFRYTECI
jgi:hypothetical protein